MLNSRYYRLPTVLAGLLLSGLFATKAYCDTVFPAVFSSGASIQNGTSFSLSGWSNLNDSLSSPGTVSETGSLTEYVGGGTASSSASTSAALTLSASGSTTATTLGLPQAVAGASVAFYYEVLGPTAYTAVPMVFSGNFSASASGANAYALAQTQYNTTTGSLGNESCAATYNTCSTTYPSGSFLDTFSVYSSSTSQGIFTQNDIGLSVQGEAYTNGQFNAGIDPILEIDPSFLAANPGYSLVESSNISTVPVPPSILLLLSGLPLLMLIRRRSSVLLP